MTSLDTPEQISLWVLLSRIHQLALELNTGLKASRGSILEDCRRQGWTKARTKKAALRDLVDLMLQVDSDYMIDSNTVGKALCCKGHCFCRTADSVPVEPEHCKVHCLQRKT